MESKRDEILDQADKLANLNYSIKDVKFQIQEHIKSINTEGPEVQSENFLLTTIFQESEPILDNYQMRQQFIRRKDSFFKIKSCCIYEPEFLLPQPEEISVEFDQLMTPFPLFIETPVINSCIDTQKIIQELFSNIHDLDDSQTQILLGLLENNMHRIDQEILFENMQKLIHINTELVAKIAGIIHRENKKMFDEYLQYFRKEGDFTLQYLETMYNLLKTCKLEQQFLDSFIQNWFNHCKKEEGQTQAKKLKLICKLMIELMKRDLFNPSNSIDIWLTLCAYFKGDKCVTELNQFIKQRIKQEERK